ncbi:MAG: metallophosphoesterase [Porphyromonadaceae bacterium]|nr:metallophosphoesterase [Porphyromonadaceae bacterium]
MIVVVLLFLLLLAVALYYTFYSLGMLAPSWPWLKVGVVGGSVACLLSLILSFAGRYVFPVWFLRWSYSLGTSWLFVFLYLMMALLLWGLVRLCLPMAREALTDNRWLALGLILCVVAVMIYGYYQYRDKKRVALEIDLDKPLPRPLKIVGISDLHLGYTIGRDELAQWVDKINAEQADIILIAGDILDNDAAPVLEERMQEELNRLEARLGVYACLGNHEYAGQEAQRRDVLSRTSIRLLQDESVLVDDAFYVVGRDDRMNPRRQSTQELVQRLDHSKPIILLDHQPYNLEHSEAAGIDFQLSGHTHRGQVFPINLLVDALYEQSHGYLRKGNSHFYVSSGIGLWGGKFRIGTQSEYVCVILR